MERKTYEFDNLYHLLAACMRRALLDAKRDPQAIAWLDRFYPEWRRFV